MVFLFVSSKMFTMLDKTSYLGLSAEIIGLLFTTSSVTAEESVNHFGHSVLYGDRVDKFAYPALNTTARSSLT